MLGMISRSRTFNFPLPRLRHDIFVPDLTWPNVLWNNAYTRMRRRKTNMDARPIRTHIAKYRERQERWRYTGLVSPPRFCSHRCFSATHRFTVVLYKLSIEDEEKESTNAETLLLLCIEQPFWLLCLIVNCRQANSYRPLLLHPTPYSGSISERSFRHVFSSSLLFRKLSLPVSFRSGV